ncbi:MAG: transcriptional regulator FtsR [Candidatus Nanopelagicales bacterium]
MRPAVAAQESLLSIGEVLGLLKSDFPDVTISKIRFLESEGLVTPQRTASGYRKFAPGDVQRLRYILGLQRDQYLPLRVIKDHLDAIDRGLQPPTGETPLRPLVSVDSLVRPEDFSAAKPVRMTAAELCEAAGIDSASLREIEGFGLVSGQDGFYSGDDFDVLRAVGALLAFGIEPRHLRAFKAAADREIGLVQQVITPIAKSKAADGVQRAAETAREIAALSVALHASLVRSGINTVAR